MPQADRNSTTSTRRSALRLSFTATAAAVLAPLASAGAAFASDPDAELIALSADLVRNGNAQSAMYVSSGLTMAEEDAQEPELLQLAAEERRLVTAIAELCPPQTMAGAHAVAAAVMSIAEFDRDGELVIWDKDRPEALALLLAEAMASGDVA